MNENAHMARWAGVVAGIGLLAATLAAADVSGTWMAQTPARGGGTETTTFQLRAEGTTLTGSVKMPLAEYKIHDGKVEGDRLRFAITVNMGLEVRFLYSGTLKGDEIAFTREIERLGRKSTFVATRAR